jgi:hypothetical protein
MGNCADHQPAPEAVEELSNGLNTQPVLQSYRRNRQATTLLNQPSQGSIVERVSSSLTPKVF